MRTKIFNSLLFFFTISVVPVISQPVLTQDGMLSASGDSTVYGRHASSPSITPIQGPDVTWDFYYDTTILTPYYFITKDPAQTPFPSSFPLANRCEIDIMSSMATRYSYQRINEGLLEELGIIFDYSWTGNNEYRDYQDYLTTLQFPVHYGDSLMDHFSGFRIQTSNDTNQQHGTRYFKADSYGTLIYSTGDTFTDVMRVYSVAHVIDSMPLTYDSTTITIKTWYKEGIRTPLIIEQFLWHWSYNYQTQQVIAFGGPIYRCLDPAYINGLILSAGFSANPSTICDGDSVTFTDLSIANSNLPTTWQWYFEGGTPATSTVQNPVITYNSEGEYDVQLIVTEGIYTDTLIQTNYVHVERIPDPPGTPAGPIELCPSTSFNYTTTSVPYATSYNWQVIPADAGTITGDSTFVVFLASSSWTGTFDIQVSAEGLCGTGPLSAPLACTLYDKPNSFNLSGTGDGVYCEGEPGSVLTLDGSETDVDYELYLDGLPSGNIVAGTGDSISFGIINTEGIYIALGYTDYCMEFMQNLVVVNQLFVPEQAEPPMGNEETCDNESNVYTTEEIAEADWYEWTLDPAQAGVLVPADDSVTINWNSGYSGNALLSVHGENICGTGPESDLLEINISLSPVPIILGSQYVIPNSEEQYQTEENPGNTYEWEVAGGNITSGGASHQVTVMWGDPGEGSLTVSEESAEGCSNITDPYLVVIGAVSIEENYPGKGLIFPNPSSSQITIELPRKPQKNTLLTIYNLNGQQLLAQPITEPQTVVDVSGLPSGVYFVKVVDDENVMVQKVIKE